MCQILRVGKNNNKKPTWCLSTSVLPQAVVCSVSWSPNLLKEMEPTLNLSPGDVAFASSGSGFNTNAFIPWL